MEEGEGRHGVCQIVSRQGQGSPGGRHRVMFMKTKHSRLEKEGKGVVEEGGATTHKAGRPWEKLLSSNVRTNVKSFPGS